MPPYRAPRHLLVPLFAEARSAADLERRLRAAGWTLADTALAGIAVVSDAAYSPALVTCAARQVSGGRHQYQLWPQVAGDAVLRASGRYVDLLLAAVALARSGQEEVFRQVETALWDEGLPGVATLRRELGRELRQRVSPLNDRVAVGGQRPRVRRPLLSSATLTATILAWDPNVPDDAIEPYLTPDVAQRLGQPMLSARGTACRPALWPRFLEHLRSHDRDPRLLLALQGPGWCAPRVVARLEAVLRSVEILHESVTETICLRLQTATTVRERRMAERLLAAVPRPVLAAFARPYLTNDPTARDDESAPAPTSLPPVPRDLLIALSEEVLATGSFAEREAVMQRLALIPGPTPAPTPACVPARVPAPPPAPPRRRRA